MLDPKRITYTLSKIRTHEDILENRKRERLVKRTLSIPSDFICPICKVRILNIKHWSLEGICLKCVYARNKTSINLDLASPDLDLSDKERVREALGVSKAQFATILGMSRINYLRVKKIMPKYHNRILRYIFQKKFSEKI